MSSAVNKRFVIKCSINTADAIYAVSTSKCVVGRDGGPRCTRCVGFIGSSRVAVDAAQKDNSQTLHKRAALSVRGRRSAVATVGERHLYLHGGWELLTHQEETLSGRHWGPRLGGTGSQRRGGIESVSRGGGLRVGAFMHLEPLIERHIRAPTTMSLY